MSSDDLRAHYDAVIKDLFARRSEHQRAIGIHQRAVAELDQLIAGMSKNYEEPVPGEASATTSKPLSDNKRAASFRTSQPPRFATISVRWAILYLLDENESLSTSEIADALQAGGIRSKASNFNNNVSAVLSNMKTGRDEVDQIGDKWTITETGRSAINHIRANFRARRSWNSRDSVRTETPDAVAAASGER
jgi:hypothetical protein